MVAPAQVTQFSSEQAFRSKFAMAPLNGALTATAICFDLTAWSGQWISTHCDGTDAYILFSDVDFATIDETATLLVAPSGAPPEPTACCFKLSEGSIDSFFVSPAYPYLHAVRGYPLNGYLRIVRS